MSKVTTTRQIDLTTLPFPAVMSWDGAAAVIEAEVSEADLRAAVDAARSELDIEAQADADQWAWRDAVSKASSIADLKAVLLGSNIPVRPVVSRGQ